MGKINLVLLDCDKHYAEDFSSFILKNHFKKFSITSFSDIKSLNSFLISSPDKIDVLLADEKFHIPSTTYENASLVISLIQGHIIRENNDNIIYINKYQHGEKIVTEILKFFADKYNFTITNPLSDTKILAVFSPCGGAGKTTLSINLSKYYSKLGLRIFYLNLESISTSSAFFDFPQDKTLSNILFYLNQKNENLFVRFQESKCIDSLYGIHYFQPPQSFTEICEASAKDIQTILSLLKTCGDYDIILVDMSSSLDKKNLEIIYSCDNLFLVTSYDKISQIKYNAFLKEIELLKLDIADKINIILNKSESKAIYENCVEIPFVKDNTHGIIDIPDKFLENLML